MCFFKSSCQVVLLLHSVLLQAGANINSKDVDGWTPLHAAAHWGMEESCKILAENMCDMEAKNLAVRSYSHSVTFILHGHL